MDWIKKAAFASLLVSLLFLVNSCSMKLGLAPISSIDYAKVQDQQPSKEEAFDKLLSRIHPGAIVLLHNTSSTNAEILDELLSKWEEMGYRFGSLNELTGI